MKNENVDYISKKDVTNWIALERRKHLTLGFTFEHDIQNNSDGQLYKAAIALLTDDPSQFPWDRSYFDKFMRFGSFEAFVIAGALLRAEDARLSKIFEGDISVELENEIADKWKEIRSIIDGIVNFILGQVQPIPLANRPKRFTYEEMVSYFVSQTSELQGAMESHGIKPNLRVAIFVYDQNNPLQAIDVDQPTNCLYMGRGVDDTFFIAIENQISMVKEKLKDPNIKVNAYDYLRQLSQNDASTDSETTTGNPSPDLHP